VLKGVVRVEGLEDATLHVGGVLSQVKPEYLVGSCRRYRSICITAAVGPACMPLLCKAGCTGDDDSTLFK
jgi:hypothetical protein